MVHMAPSISRGGSSPTPTMRIQRRLWIESDSYLILTFCYSLTGVIATPGYPGNCNITSAHRISRLLVTLDRVAPLRDLYI
ncbi:hypothetical protein BO85DRAFT_136977 [Aspergillus piperis CBS 112811]|uniref:Uncharacterized protein n=1 Tax=Aspergillus piperis CBS 112811 TaxID=1448313 RepID=A0A8G1RAT4_9EURO|nr:hypothetical protein BO85DRAFT_136977 [Aspergillus piperis CBS 112811]RAH62463.1 hypothetical protein BO85DRAFT_136977 [Aspergillus piperis CBS 112811]